METTAKRSRLRTQPPPGPETAGVLPGRDHVAGAGHRAVGERQAIFSYLADGHRIGPGHAVQLGHRLFAVGDQSGAWPAPTSAVQASSRPGALFPGAGKDPPVTEELVDSGRQAGAELERATGIEPAFSAWEADVLPLYDARWVPCFRLPNASPGRPPEHWRRVGM